MNKRINAVLRDAVAHGSGELQRLRASIAKHVPSILDQLVSAAQGGDVQAARLILERVLPPVKAIEQTQELDFPEGGTLDRPRPRRAICRGRW